MSPQTHTHRLGFTFLPGMQPRRGTLEHFHGRRRKEPHTHRLTVTIETGRAEERHTGREPR